LCSCGRAARTLLSPRAALSTPPLQTIAANEPGAPNPCSTPAGAGRLPAFATALALSPLLSSLEPARMRPCPQHFVGSDGALRHALGHTKMQSAARGVAACGEVLPPLSFICTKGSRGARWTPDRKRRLAPQRPRCAAAGRGRTRTRVGRIATAPRVRRTAPAPAPAAPHPLLPERATPRIAPEPACAGRDAPAPSPCLVFRRRRCRVASVCVLTLCVHV
jgi:hypothetical protein